MEHTGRYKPKGPDRRRDLVRKMVCPRLTVAALILISFFPSTSAFDDAVSLENKELRNNASFLEEPSTIYELERNCSILREGNVSFWGVSD